VAVGEGCGDDRGERNAGQGGPYPLLDHAVYAFVVVEHVEPRALREVGHDWTLRPEQDSRVTRYD
jgi:hypothetical protein